MVTRASLIGESAGALAAVYDRELARNRVLVDMRAFAESPQCFEWQWKQHHTKEELEIKFTNEPIVLLHSNGTWAYQQDS